MCGYTWPRPARCGLDDVVDRLAGHLVAALRYEQPRQPVGAGGQIAFDRPQLGATTLLLPAASAFAAVTSAIAFANLAPLFFIKAGATQALAI